MSSFFNLTAEQRDELLITIPYVEQPIKHAGLGEGEVDFYQAKLGKLFANLFFL